MCRPPLRCRPRPVEMRLLLSPASCPFSPPRHFAGGGEKSAQAATTQTVPPVSAGIPPASCRRRSARSGARSGRRAPSPADRAGGHAASSRAPRTTHGNGPAAARPRKHEIRRQGGAAPARRKSSGTLRRGQAAPCSTRATQARGLLTLPWRGRVARARRCASIVGRGRGGVTVSRHRNFSRGGTVTPPRSLRDRPSPSRGG